MGKFIRNKNGKPNTLRDQFQIGDYTLGSLTASSLTVTGNVTTSGGNFVGDGSALTGVTATPAGSNTELQYNNGGSLGASSNLTYNNSTNILSAPVIATNEIASPDSSVLIINDGVATYGDVSTTGSIIVDDSVAVENNVTMNGGTIQLEGQSGNVSANNISVGNTVTVTGNLTGGNLITAGLVSATGNVTGGNLTTAGDVTTVTVTASGAITSSTTITATGNVTGGNLVTAGKVDATGNITTSGAFIGDGSQLTGVVASSYAVTSGDVTAHQANLSITESQISDLSHYANSDVDSHLNQSNPTDGYVLSWTSGDYAWVAQSSGGLGNIVEDTTPQLGGDLDLNSNDINGSGNVNVTGNISATTTITATGNVTGGNLITGAQVVATGNVTGGNLVTSADVTTATVTASGNISVGGILFADTGTHEKFSTLTSATGTVTHDCSNGHVFYHTSPSADFTANFTNLNLGNTYATTTTLVMVQGGTARIANAVSIGGSAQTINWQGGAEPTGTANGVDVISFSILNNSGTYTVLGQLVDFND